MLVWLLDFQTRMFKCRHFVKFTLKKMVEKKLITQVKGQGATGSFKLLKAAVIKPKKVVKKVLKKKAAAKKLQLKRNQNHLVLQRKQPNQKSTKSFRSYTESPN